MQLDRRAQTSCSDDFVAVAMVLPVLWLEMMVRKQLEAGIILIDQQSQSSSSGEQSKNVGFQSFDYRKDKVARWYTMVPETSVVQLALCR